MSSGTARPAPTHVPSTDPTAPLGHGRGQEAAPREALSWREHAGSSVLPTPCHRDVCVPEMLGATSSHKGGVIATNCKGSQKAKPAPRQALCPNCFSSGQHTLVTKSH